MSENKKEEKKALTIKDLIAKKDEIKSKGSVTKELFIVSLGGNITIQAPTKSVYYESRELDANGKNGDAHFVYNCVISPNLKDTNLHKEFGVVEPIEIVEAIFNTGEIMSIANELLVLSGFGNSVQAIKN